MLLSSDTLQLTLCCMTQRANLAAPSQQSNAVLVYPQHHSCLTEADLQRFAVNRCKRCIFFRSVDGKVRRYDIRAGKLTCDTIGRELCSGKVCIYARRGEGWNVFGVTYSAH